MTIFLRFDQGLNIPLTFVELSNSEIWFLKKLKRKHMANYSRNVSGETSPNLPFPHPFWPFGWYFVCIHTNMHGLRRTIHAITLSGNPLGLGPIQNVTHKSRVVLREGCSYETFIKPKTKHTNP